MTLKPQSPWQKFLFTDKEAEILKEAIHEYSDITGNKLAGVLYKQFCDTPIYEKPYEWQPIETAPLDTRILLWWRPIDDNPYAETVVCGQISSYEQGKWFNDRSEYQDAWHVTAWMPLPLRGNK